MGVTLWAFERTDDSASMSYTAFGELHAALEAAADGDRVLGRMIRPLTALDTYDSGKLDHQDCQGLLKALDELESKLSDDMRGLASELRPLLQAAADSEGDTLLVAQ